MKIFPFISSLALLVGAAASAGAQEQNLVVTASNAPTNQLLVYNTSGKLVQAVATGGEGGVSGNAGGVTAWNSRLAVVNFGSKNVSLFESGEDGLHLSQIIAADSSPVSVAFGHDHLYILGTTHVESHRVYKYGVDPSPDGIVLLVKADGSAAQVGVIDTQLIISEKSNAIESVDLNWDGAVKGSAALVENIPSNVNAPFGLVTRNDDAYVTIAHANEISLVRNDAVVTVTGSGTQSAPCWVTLDGPFLFSSNSPSMSISRYLVYGMKIVQEAAVAATLKGDPTDIDYRWGLLSVIDSNGTVSHLSTFNVDGDGNLTLKSATTLNSANGIAIVRVGE